MSKINPDTKNTESTTRPGMLCEPKPFPQVDEVVTVNVKDVHGLVQREVESVLASLPFYQVQCITVQDAAALLKCFPDTIRVYIRSGQLLASKIGKDYRIRIADLDKFLKENQTKAVVRRMHSNHKKGS